MHATIICDDEITMFENIFHLISHGKEDKLSVTLLISLKNMNPLGQLKKKEICEKHLQDN